MLKVWKKDNNKLAIYQIQYNHLLRIVIVFRGNTVIDTNLNKQQEVINWKKH